MRDPIRRLKWLPWRSLLQVTALVLAIVIGLEFLLSFGLRSGLIFSILELLYSPPWSLITSFAVAIAIGALATWSLAKLDPPGVISAPTLWALILCLAVGLLIKRFLPLPLSFVSLDYMQLVGLIVGIFWKGRPYWR